MKANGHQSVFAVMVTVFVTCSNVRSQNGCVQAGIGLSCTFEDGFCGWKNAAENDFDWKKESEAFDSNYHATAESDVQNSIARLQSPWLCATGTKTTSFRFGYYMGRDSGVCRLSVMVKSRSGTVVLTTRHRHEGSDYLPVGPLYIVCPHNQYQIIVEAKKLTSESCGYATKGIDIDNTEVSVENGVRQTAYFCPEPFTTTRQSAGTIIPSPLFTTTEGSISTQSSIRTTRKSILTSKGLSSEPFTDSTSEATEEQHFTDGDRQTGENDSGLAGGAVAGIIGAVVVVVAVIAVVVIYLTMRGIRATAYKVPQMPNVLGNGAPQAATNLNFSFDHVSEPVTTRAPAKLSGTSMLKPLVQVISAAILIDLLARVQSQADDKRCVPANDTQNLSQNVSCEFTHDLCGWQSDVNVKWKTTRVDRRGGGYFYFSYVNTRDLPANSSTRLVSPWLCASEHGVYSLSFSYYLPIYSPERCRLSVLLSVGDNVRPLKVWTATSATGDSPYSHFPSVSPISITCEENPFQIYFEAEKLSNTSCGGIQEIGIHYIRLTHSTILEGTLFTCPSLPTPASDATKADDDGCLGGGAMADIVVGAIVFVVIVIVFFVLIVRRGLNKDNVATSMNSRSPGELQAASNTGFDQYEPIPDPGAERMTAHLAPGHADMNVTTRGRPVQGSRPVYVNTVSGSMTHPLDSNETMTTNPPSQQSVTRSTGHFEEENRDYLTPRLPSSFHTDIVSGQRPGNYEPLNMYRTDAATYTQLTNTGQPPRNA